MRPRVHHLEGSEPVYRGDDVFRMARRSGRDVDELCGFLAANPAVDWRGYFREASRYGHDCQDALRVVQAAYREAFGQDLRGTDFEARLRAVAGEVYGA